MHQSYIRPSSAVAAAPAIAATTGYSSDEILVERIAAGDKLAMQVLFVRHRTNVYRWLLRFVLHDRALSPSAYHTNSDWLVAEYGGRALKPFRPVKRHDHAIPLLWEWRQSGTCYCAVWVWRGER